MPRLEDATAAKDQVQSNGTPDSATDTPPVKEDKKSPRPRPTKDKEPEPTLLYPDVEFHKFTGPDAMKVDTAKQYLGWQTEDEYKAEKEKDPKVKKTDDGKPIVPGFNEDYFTKDYFDVKVRCPFNTKNRPFERSHALSLAQSILNSGPGLPLEKRDWHYNGEDILIGAYGQCLSGQHRLIALILAYQMWVDDQKNNGGKKYGKSWPTQPVLETGVKTGISEEPYVLRTFDNTKPTTLSDVLYRDPAFKKELPGAKRELSGMLAKAVNFLWERTGASQLTDYQTHGESVEFLGRHPKLYDFVKNLFTLDGGNRNESGTGRTITGLGFSNGLCAGLQYLMAASATNPDKYKANRSQRAINWEFEDKANGFFIDLSNKSNLRESVESLMKDLDNDELSGTKANICLLVEHWNLYVKCAPDEEVLPGEITQAKFYEDHFKENSNGKLRFYNPSDVGGIDIGDKQEPTEEDKAKDEEAKKKVDADRNKKMDKVIDTVQKTGSKTIGEEAAVEAAKIRARQEARAASKK